MILPPLVVGVLSSPHDDADFSHGPQLLRQDTPYCRFCCRSQPRRGEFSTKRSCRCPRGRIQALSSSFRGAHTSCSRPARAIAPYVAAGVTGDHAQAPLAPAARRHRAHRSSADNSPRGLIFSHELARGTPRRYPYTRPRSRPSISRWSCRACAPDTTNQPTLAVLIFLS